MSSPKAELTGNAPPGRRFTRPRRLLACGCLTLVLAACGLPVLAFGLAQGGFHIALPGSASLDFGRDDFVLSNYSFQNGTTYFADLRGTGLREILQVNVVSDTHKLEFVLHHATRQDQKEIHLLDYTGP